MTKIVIIHGTKGSPQGNWFPWLASQLRCPGVEVVVPQMPTPEGQSLTTWLEAFTAAVGDIDSHTIIIGHSVGAVFLLRLLERLSSPIGGSVFVAGFTGALGLPEYDALIATFVAGPYQWHAIRANAGEVFCISGADDPYVPLEQGLEIAKNLNVTPTVVEGGGHLNAEFGYTKFPLLQEKLTGILYACQREVFPSDASLRSSTGVKH